VNALTESASLAALCAQCGLPLGRRPISATVAGAREQFCCYGCVLALQVTRARGERGAAAAILVRLGLGCFFAMNVMMLSLPTAALAMVLSSATVVANARRLARG
jgi:Cu2+-exporting ATPase